MQLDEQSRHCQDLLEENSHLKQLQLEDAKESYEATAFFRYTQLCSIQHPLGMPQCKLEETADVTQQAHAGPKSTPRRGSTALQAGADT